MKLFSTRQTFLVVLLLGVLGMTARNVTDPDVWWHLETGKYIATFRSVPHTDPFSYTRFGQPWIAHEWLSDLLIFGAYRAVGWGGLIVMFAAVLCAGFLVLYLRCKKNAYGSGVIVLWGALATAPLWGIRPQILTLLLASIWLLILDRSERDRNLLWWTLPLTILWVNLHAGYAIGLALVALFLIGEYLETSGTPVRFSPRLRTLALTLLLSVLLVPLNPNGFRMFWYPFETLRSTAMQTYVAEWASPNFHRPEYWPFLLLLLATTAAIAWSRNTVRPRNLVLLLAGTVAGLSSIRMIPIFVLVAVPVLSQSVGVWPRPNPSKHRVGPLAATANLAILLAMTGFVGSHVIRVIQRQPASETSTFPVAAAAYLEAHPAEAPLFNHYDWGGYLIWRLYPGTRVFIDGRADLYGDDFLNEFARTYQFKKDWQEALVRWDVATVVIPADSALAPGLRGAEGWSIVYDDSHAVIFSRLAGREKAP
jgi:hypothetical protein